MASASASASAACCTAASRHSTAGCAGRGVVWLSAATSVVAAAAAADDPTDVRVAGGETSGEGRGLRLLWSLAAEAGVADSSRDSKEDLWGVVGVSVEEAGVAAACLLLPSVGVGLVSGVAITFFLSADCGERALVSPVW